MDIVYKVKFFTDWHCGSGLAAGADVDALVIKDDKGIPYIPGKTVKGLLREAVEDILAFKRNHMGADYEKEKQLFIDTFGYYDGVTEETGAPLQRAEMKRGTAFFTNVELPEAEREYIGSESLQRFMCRDISSTAIDENGIAKEHSLRKMEVTVPCTLEGKILGIPDDAVFQKLIEEAMSYIKRMGQNRNRGLGRCSFSIIEQEQ